MQIDHVHFYVENAKEWRDWFIRIMGLSAIASGYNDHTQTEVVSSHDRHHLASTVIFVFSSPLSEASPVAQFLRCHPPGIADIAFAVTDLPAVVKKAIAAGATLQAPMQQWRSPHGRLKWCQIQGKTHLTHTLIERTGITLLLPQDWIIEQPLSVKQSVIGHRDASSRQLLQAREPDDTCYNGAAVAPLGETPRPHCLGNLNASCSWGEPHHLLNANRSWGKPPRPRWLLDAKRQDKGARCGGSPRCSDSRRSGSPRPHWLRNALSLQRTGSQCCDDFVSFTGIDHLVLNVAAGNLEETVSWYEQALGFQRKQTFTIQTEQSGLYSQVMVHPVSGVQLPVNEPLSANSQIQEFLDFNHGPGIQHIALKTTQITEVIKKLRAAGLTFLKVPLSYYTQLHKQYPDLNLSIQEWEQIVAQEILVDYETEGSWESLEAQNQSPLLLQIFTQPIFKQPTFFFEFIERRYQAKGFGEGNFRALFEAIEREQLKRSDLMSDHT